ncbi:hypothetical protein L596_004903 [Steinernema carpocapsae]|uniref:Uncharacterized protein n=1 Tax=Steinernema carpocapsae TaxID=34508 RepID=A0A4U8UXA2_STECR|nr:hypothetical protein L596_004903 [Steinernema carpocapsae]
MPRVPPPTPPHTPALPRVKDSDGLYAVYVPSGIGSPSGEVFKSLKDASMFATSPLPKRYGARFKRFTSKQDAEAYALRGGDSASIKPETLSDRDTVEKVCSEPVVPFPSVTKPQLGEVKRAIEKFHNDIFVNLAEQNPRVLINTSADTPTIIAEGCRYNALHIASKCGNCAVVKYVIELVKDHESLAKIYGTKDVAFRSEVLLENFLTTPDKGENNTPLHFASKFGFVDIVALLTQYSACNLSALNKYEMSPLQVACSRYSGEGDAKKKRVSEISKYIGAYYIPLYRSADFPILTAPTYRYPRPTLNPNEIDVSKCSGDGS